MICLAAMMALAHPALAVPPPPALGELQAEVGPLFPAGSAGAIMDVKTGLILAMVHPELLVSEAHPPGSIMKIATAYAASGAELGERVLSCDGTDTHRGVTRTCWLKGGHGRITLRQAIAASCDVFFYKVSRLIGPDRLLAASRALGLGTTTGSGIAGEVTGRIPSPILEEDVPSYAVGRTAGLSVTGLELLSLMAALGNGGTLVTPHRDGAPAPRGKLTDSAALDIIARGLRDAVQGGTGAAASDLPIAGKTGTAPTGNGDATLAWFAGFAPDDAPEVAVVVFFSDGLGARDAAATAADMTRAYFRWRGFR